MKSVFVDFNEYYANEERGMLACYPDHVEDHAHLEIGERVWLTDHDGLRCTGTVEGFENYGRGDLVRVKAAGDFEYM